MKRAILILSILGYVFSHGDHHHDHDHDHDHDHHDHDHHDGHGHSHEVKQSSKPAHPVIPPTLMKRIDFLETFQNGLVALEKGWVASKNERYFGQEWTVASYNPAFEGDKALTVQVKHKHYGLTHVLNEPFDNTKNTLVFQYEVQFQEGIGCSGAYAKLLMKQPEFDPLQLEESTPYVVMFGPDKCGSTNKVHFIVRQKQGNTEKYEEKHMKKVVSAKTDALTHLYTLIIRPDNSFSVKVDGVEEASGNLLSPSDFEPPFGASKEIDDPNDKKPFDWVDVKEIPDPASSKPADWDENAPETIPDPDAKKPADWIDEDDGEWVAPQIPNPEYKGKWKSPMIPNPQYKGEWKPKKIPNPNYFADETPSNLQPISAISFEILANDRGISFDNILLTHDEAAASEYSSLTFSTKATLEKTAAETSKREKAREERLKGLEEGGPSGIIKYYWGEFLDLFLQNLIPFIVAISAVVLSCVYFCCFTGNENIHQRPTVIPEEDEEEEDDNDATSKQTATITPVDEKETTESQKKDD